MSSTKKFLSIQPPSDDEGSEEMDARPKERRARQRERGEVRPLSGPAFDLPVRGRDRVRFAGLTVTRECAEFLAQMAASRGISANEVITDLLEGWAAKQGQRDRADR